MTVHSDISKTGILIGGVVTVALAALAIVILQADWTGEGGSGLGEEFTYDLTELRKIDPQLILYEQVGRIATGFEEARGVAVGADDRIYVTGDKAVRVFDKSGQGLSEIELAGPPRTLAAVEDGTLYICMKDHVEVRDARGKLQARWDALGEEAVLTSIAVSTNDVFVADAGNRIVLRYDAAGNLVGRIGQEDKERNIPGFNIPSPHFDLAVAPDGLLRVVNPGRRLIEAYTFDGDREIWWGESSPAIEGFSGCCNPANFAILPDGGFVTCEKGLTRVKIYDPQGKFVGVVAGPEQLTEDGQACTGGGGAECTSRARDVAVDSRGRVLVLDPLTGDVRIFTRIEKPPSGGKQS